MITYYTRLRIPNDFDSKQLMELVINWLQNSRNKMEGLNYQGESSFKYEIQCKRLWVETFHEDIFAVQFTTSDNRGHNQFVVELILNKINHNLRLIFKKEYTKDSTYLPGINLPNIFKMIFETSKNELRDQPYYMRYHDYLAFKEEHKEFPIVVLRRNQRCLLDPYRLSKDVLGLALVVIVPTKREPTIQIIYPNQKVETITDDNKFEIHKKLQNYQLIHHHPLTFDDLYNGKLQEEHQLYEELTTLTIEDYNAQIDQLYEEIKQIEEENMEYARVRQELQKEFKQLESLLELQNKESLLVVDTFDNQVQKEVLMELFKRVLRDLDANKIYRRADILLSIIEENS